MNSDKSLVTADDYERALKEIEVYFENQPNPGTKEAARFRHLVALIKEYEDRHFPMPD